jgi:hypothetical protein
MNEGLVKILDGNTFVVSDSRGDIEEHSEYPSVPVVFVHFPSPLEPSSPRAYGTFARDTTRAGVMTARSACGMSSASDVSRAGNIRWSAYRAQRSQPVATARDSATC